MSDTKETTPNESVPSPHDKDCSTTKSSSTETAKTNYALKIAEKLIHKLKDALDDEKLKNDIYGCVSPLYDEVYYKVYPYFLVFIMTLVIIIILLIILICK
jgi:hypothetical protein